MFTRKYVKKGTRNNRPNAFDVQPTQPSASQQFRFLARRVDVDNRRSYSTPELGDEDKAHTNVCTHILF